MLLTLYNDKWMPNSYIVTTVIVFSTYSSSWAYLTFILYYGISTFTVVRAELDTKISIQASRSI